MRLSIIFICLLTGCILNAQSWEPFVIDRTYYYGQLNQPVSHIQRLTAYTPAVGELIFFHPTECVLIDIISKGTFVFDYAHVFQSQFLFSYKDDENITFILLNPEGDDFQEVSFRPLAKPGESWQSEDITITCTGDTLTQIFGVEDSVRVFAVATPPFDTSRMILSKSHGLVRFPSFHNFLLSNPEDFQPDYFLIGLHDSLTSKGYRQPKFEKYFDLDPGDVLFWKHYSTIYIPDMRQDTLLHVDTILSVAHYSDTIQYTRRRATFDVRGHFIQSAILHSYYSRQKEGKLLESHPGWFTEPIDPLHLEPSYGMEPLQLRIIGGDTLTDASFRSAFNNFNTVTCEIDEVIDNSISLGYTAPIGLTSSSWYGIGGWNSSYLIGSIIQGIHSGTTEIPTAITETRLSSYQIYPNPTSDILHIKADDDMLVFVELYDLHGRLIQRERYSGSIDLTAIVSGLYLLKLIDTEQRTVAINRIVRH